MSDEVKLAKAITIEAMKSGFVVCLDRLTPGKIQDWYCFSTAEEALTFIENNIGGEDSVL